MKTLFYSTIALIFIAVNINAQNFTFTRTSPEWMNDTARLIVSYGSINNLTSSNIQIRLIRIANNVPFGWLSSMCDISQCYPSTRDTTDPEQYSPGPHDISIDFSDTNAVRTPGMGQVIVMAQRVGGTSESHNATFGASTFPVGIRQINSIVNEFKLNQNYPNPFNPTTRIGFTVDKSDYVDLRLYDILGREVKVLLSQPMNPGEYEIDFKADNLASGMYYYRLQSGDNVAVKKMTLVK